MDFYKTVAAVMFNKPKTAVTYKERHITKAAILTALSESAYHPQDEEKFASGQEWLNSVIGQFLDQHPNYVAPTEEMRENLKSSWTCYIPDENGKREFDTASPES